MHMLVGEKIRKVKSLIIKKIVKNNQGMRNDCGVMAANDVIKKIVSKSYHEKLLYRVCMH